jgi:pyruvate/2-oxoglutarate/acetoin dehydrogenase E1 component
MMNMRHVIGSVVERSQFGADRDSTAPLEKGAVLPRLDESGRAPTFQEASRGFPFGTEFWSAENERRLGKRSAPVKRLRGGFCLTRTAERPESVWAPLSERIFVTAEHLRAN